MPQAIALAITWFMCFVFENLTNKFICLVLEEFPLVGNPAEEAIGHQLLARARLIRERPRPVVEQTMPETDLILIDLYGL